MKQQWPFFIVYFLLTHTCSVYAQTNRVGIREASPLYTLQVTHANGTPAAAAGNGIAITHDLGSQWIMYVSNTGNELRFYQGGIQEVAFTGDGSINTLSDERAKKNIAPLADGQLKYILALTPKTYQYTKSNTNKLCTGFLAQELFKVLPDVVNYTAKDDDGKETWMVNYQGIIPHMVKAMQEQQDIINQQQKEIQTLKQTQENILKRLAALEGK
jgi:Chaperone of endosialidase